MQSLAKHKTQNKEHFPHLCLVEVTQTKLKVSHKQANATKQQTNYQKREKKNYLLHSSLSFDQAKNMHGQSW